MTRGSYRDAVCGTKRSATFDGEQGRVKRAQNKLTRGRSQPPHAAQGMEGASMTMTATTDESLPVDIGADERTASALMAPADFNELVTTYAPRLLRVARLVTGSDNAAQDVTQEVFLRVWKNGGYDATRGSLDAWLQTMTRNIAIDWLRCESAHRRRLTLVGSIHTATAAVVDETVVARSQAACVRAAVARLPAIEREVLSLAYFGGLSYRQVAEQLGLADGTVKSRIRRALTRLANTIEAVAP